LQRDKWSVLINQLIYLFIYIIYYKTCTVQIHTKCKAENTILQHTHIENQSLRHIIQKSLPVCF